MANTYTVDGITSHAGGVWVREIFQFVDDHSRDENKCGACQHYPAATKDAMHWRPGDPIVRFTPSGLEVT